MNKTQIEWVKNPDGTQGYTWNPITGCLNGCEYCYARKLANGRLKPLYLANHKWTTCEVPHNIPALLDPFYPRFWPERLAELEPPLAKVNYERYGYQCRRYEPYRKEGRKPKGIFVCDMSDLFGIGIPEEWTRKVLSIIAQNPQDRFYLLTKQPQNLIKFSPFPENCWVGVTATDTKMAWNAYADLADIHASLKFLSLEPLLGQIDTRMIDNFKGTINWVIIGAQTKPTVYPKIEWVEEIVQACDKAGVKVFLKDNLKPLFKPNYEVQYPWAYNWGQFRQEIPVE